MSASEYAEDGGVDLLAMLTERYESPQVRGTAFERLMLRAFQRHPDVYGPQRFARVWRWAEWPEREALGYGADIGIDLVAEQTEAAGGGLCAIQTKAYATGRVDKGAVDSFISASATDDFAARLLVLTAPPTAQARLMVEKASPRCEVLHRSDLESWPVNWSECLDDPSRLRFITEDRHTPKPFQAEAVAKVVAGFTEHDRGRLVLPCGTGKSVVSLWIAERLAGVGGRVLYLVPSIALMNQTMREWASQCNPAIAHRYIGVCSDTRAGHTAEDARLVELAMPVTTDPDRITAQLTATDTSAMTVVFCTYQSLSLIADAQSDASLFGPAPAFDLAICDEAHRTTGIEETAARKPASDSHRTVTPYSLIHDPSRVHVAKRLYMTATPRVYTESARSRVQNAAGSFDVYSMDDPAVYGPEMYRMSFGEAVEGGHLTDYKVLVIAVAENPVLDAYDNIAIDEEHQFKIHDAVRFAGCWDGLADPTTTTPDDRVTGAVNHDHAAQRVIAFTNRIRNSQLVERYWNPVIEAVAGAVHGRSPSEGNGAASELLACDIRHVDGNKNALERADTIAWLRAGDPEGACRIVTNARCLSEGIDVPALDAVIFLEPKQSQVDVIQAVGRVMRRAPRKDVGYVILPVVVPSGTSLLDDAVLNGSDFKAVWKVLKALRSHDERLDVLINTADLTGKPPITVLPSGLCGTCGKADSDCECDQARLDDAASVRAGQQRLPFEHAIASQLVKACGDRQYWDRWGREVARITGTITSHVQTAVGADADLAATFDRFAEQMQATVGGTVAAGDLAALVAQHVVTMPVFEALFAGSGFADRNPISKALNELLDEFKAADVRLRDETADLDRFYDSVRNRLSGAADSDARLKIMLEVYESFFKEAMPAEITRLGIVYTPVELVDFMLRSVDAVLRQEFGRGLTSEGVHILDPFTGTGTFINRLLTQRNSDDEPFIADEDLARKFVNTHNPLVPGGSVQEIHANEIVLLAYYLAAIKIEEGYRERTGGYEPFSGIVLTDTFAHDPSALPGTGTLGYNSARAHQQNELPIQVILGNPPWSAGQKSAGDDNPNVEHPHIEQRVRDTYGRRHREVTGRGAGKAMGNLYVEALRWASDRLNEPESDPSKPGVIAFVHPNSLSNAPSLAGMRAALRSEFTSIYVVNLLGDAMKSGEEYRREGDKVFGQGSRNGVQITILVRNPACNGGGGGDSAVLRYAEVPERSSLRQKFDWLADLADVTNQRLVTVPANESHDWVNVTDGSFNKLMPVCQLGRQGNDLASVVSDHALGIATNCDVYVYSFSRDELARRMRPLIDAYNDALELVEAGCDIDECTENDDLARIKWTGTLKQSLRRREEIVFDEGRIREVLYRPFTKLWLYEDARILSSVKSIANMFRDDHEDESTEREREREREREESRSAARRAGHDSQRWRSGNASISTASTAEHASLPGRGPTDDNAVQPDRIRRSRHPDAARPARARPGLPGGASQTTSGTTEAAMSAKEVVLVTSPNNRAIFSALATTYPADLSACGTNQPTRAIPRQRLS
ncbi:MAG: DEAD/DEAH box helicase family protein [Acidimicrobiaceae bacterium]|nr:DEAD/DEAH box helicase family protein [Acidimicrobiaceae bacterium]